MRILTKAHAQVTPPKTEQKILSGEELYQAILPSTMTLSVETKNGTALTGTAFMGVKEGIAVTAWHVVRDAKRVVAKFSNGEEFDVSGLIDRDEKRDVALIRVKVFGRPPITISPQDPSIGAKSYVIGAPKGLEFSLSDGIISGVRTLDGFKNVQFTCAASPGNSGGPLVNAMGEVIGVVSWQSRDGQNLNFAIPTCYVLALDATLPTQPWDNVKALSPLMSDNSSTGPTASNDEFDKLLADSVIQTGDLIAASSYVWRKVIRERFGYQDGLPVVFLTVVKNSQNKMDEIVQSHSSDTARERQKKFFLAHLQAQLTAAQKLAEAVKTAQHARGFTPEANEQIKEGFAQLDADISSLSKEDTKALAKSSIVMNNLPRDERIALGLEERQTKFPLGVVVYPRKPMLFVLVDENSVAKKLGFKDGDTLIEVDTKKFSDIETFRVFLVENAGKKVPAVILRDGDQKQIELKIPADLPK